MTGLVRRNFAVGLLVAYALLSLAVSPEGETASAQTPPAASPRVLVTTDGRVIEGPMVANGLGYTVYVNGGQMVVPQSVIKFTATSRHDAYLQYVELMPEATPDNRVSLARWCATNQLYSDAKHELVQALKQDPNHIIAREMLVMLEKTLNAPPVENTVRVLPRRDEMEFAAAREESTGGLTPELVKDYVTTIQPILMNNCAQAGCHHKTAENNFKLEFVRLSSYSTRLPTERNLQAVLEIIEKSSLESNPIIEKARERHGGAHRSLALEPKGKVMLARLEQWIAAVSKDRSPQAATTAHATRRDNKNLIQQVSAVEEAESFERRPAATDEQFVQEILHESRPDRFDPAKFNRGRR